ncbi:MAG: phosphoethanolamine--lipid A transferase [Psychrobacter sp.]|nr:phosphoethanolamine--lipid A transferase [Psychrobacter sp.]
MNTPSARGLFAKYPISLDIVIFLTALFVVLSANLGFFQQALNIYSFKDNAAFIISLGGVLLGLTWLIFQLLSYRRSYRFVLIFMVIIAAICAYFTDTYGTIFDRNMLINGLQTDQSEARDLLAPSFIIRVLLLGIVPAVILYKIQTPIQSFKKALIHKTVTILMALALVAVCILPFGDQYASFFRQHKQVRYYTNPITPVYSAIKLGQVYYKDLTRPTSIVQHASDAVKTPTADHKPKLMVLVVGETARADHISLNGYPRETMPLLAKQPDVYSYQQAFSCGTSTAYSVPCMFSYLGQKDYNMDEADYQENVIDTLSRLGVKVVWRDNNSSSKGVADRVTYEDFKTPGLNPDCEGECRDVGMLTGFDKLVSAQSPQPAKQSADTLIVLHQMGNHGPAYYKRYPKAFEKFKPVCMSNELSKCDAASLINGYDNALLYTDFFLNSTIETLKKYQDRYDVVMVYMSDHGESLGENNIYLHGLPYKVAPEAQKHVPLIIWSPAGNHVDTASIKAQLNQPVTHDYITPTLLKFFNIQTQAVAGKPTFFDTQ